MTQKSCAVGMPNAILRNHLKSFTLFITVKAIAKLNLGHRNRIKIKFYKISRRIDVLQTTQNWSFHVVVWQRTAKKFTKSYNARAQSLFCSLHLVFRDVSVAVAVAVVVILNSLPTKQNASSSLIKEFLLKNTSTLIQ